VIGAATLSTPIGQTSLGNYIFTGLQTQNWIYVLFGCIAAALLAIAVDQLLGLIEAGVKRRRRTLQALGALGLLGVASLSLLSMSPRQGTSYVVGAKPFAEQYILGALIQQRLDAGGLAAVRRDGLGSAVIFDALVQGEIDVYVEYTGTLWANQMKRTDVLPRARVLEEVTRWAAETHGVKVLGSLGFENAYTLAMPRRKAAELGVTSDSDLARFTSRMSVAGDYEFFGRPEWLALRQTYGFNFRAQRQMQPEFMYAAAAAGDVDVIAGYTSDGRMAQFDLLALSDDRGAIPPYDAILLVSPKRARDERLAKALHPLLDTISLDLMREANRKIGSEPGGSPEAIAGWLWQQIGSQTTRRAKDP
jgi:osmoprotectant transport system permease protein